MYVEQVLKGPALTKFRNDMLVCKELVRNETGYHWDLGEPEDVAFDDLWAFWKIGGLWDSGDDITDKDRYIDIERALCFILGRSMWKRYHNVFNEHIYYVTNDIQKPFKLGTVEYSKRVCEIF